MRHMAGDLEQILDTLISETDIMTHSVLANLIKLDNKRLKQSQIEGHFREDYYKIDKRLIIEPN